MENEADMICYKNKTFMIVGGLDASQNEMETGRGVAGYSDSVAGVQSGNRWACGAGRVAHRK